MGVVPNEGPHDPNRLRITPLSPLAVAGSGDFRSVGPRARERPYTARMAAKLNISGTLHAPARRRRAALRHAGRIGRRMGCLSPARDRPRRALCLANLLRHTLDLEHALENAKTNKGHFARLSGRTASLARGRNGSYTDPLMTNLASRHGPEPVLSATDSVRPAFFPHRHLLGIQGLERRDIEACLRSPRPMSSTAAKPTRSCRYSPGAR